MVRRAFLNEGLLRAHFVLFNTGSADLLPYSQRALLVVAKVLEEFPGARIRVEGYADPRGGEAYNLALSKRRAESVRDFLVGEGGLDPSRLEAEGYGETHLVSTGTSPTELALNRRVEFRVLNPEALHRDDDR